MSNAGYATLTVIPSAKGFASALSKQVDGTLTSAGSSASRKLSAAGSSGVSSGASAGATKMTAALNKASDDAAQVSHRSSGAHQIRLLETSLHARACARLGLGAWRVAREPAAQCVIAVAREWLATGRRRAGMWLERGLLRPK